jgi:aspartyl-tRNA(Asn)/glutamyl-tRNA(Gln) amidotransferase subunit C
MIDLEQVAKLASLELSPEEKKLFAPQMSAILDYANNLQKLNTQNVSPTTHALPLKNIFRDDGVTPCENIEPIMANAPEVEKQMFKVPKIIK